jgi:hypothetical protein
MVCNCPKRLPILICKKQSRIFNLKEVLDYFSDSNNLSTTKISDKELKELETLKIQTPSKDNIVVSLFKLEMDLCFNATALVIISHMWISMRVMSAANRLRHDSFYCNSETSMPTYNFNVD